VRLSFHDSVTWDPQSGTGGSNAWISVPCGARNQCERTLDANKGLPQVADYLDYLWIKNGWQHVISRPDWWSLAAKVSVEWASGGTCNINWGYGRTQASSIQAWPNRHPLPPEGFQGIGKHMVTRLGFSWEESVALIGAHCLGETHIENTGYHGRWVPTPANFFSNSFYQNLLHYDWYPTAVPCNSTSYGSGCNVEYVSDELPGAVMLITDGALEYQTGKLKCTLTRNQKSNLYANRCPFATKAVQGYVSHFASNNNYWLQTFASAFEKLQNLGHDQIVYNPQTDVQYDLYQTHWQGYSNWYNNQKDYGYGYTH